MKLTKAQLKIHREICDKILKILKLQPYYDEYVMPILKKIQEGKIDNIKITD